MVYFPTEHRGLLKVAAAKLGKLFIIAPSVRPHKVGDAHRAAITILDA